MQLEKYEKIAESILFAGGDPVDIKVISEAMEIDEDAACSVLESLKVKYEKIDSSLQILKLDNSWQICTKKDFEPYIRQAFEIKRNAPLSQAAFEVLAVIAYNQPVTRAFIEQVRGVDSTSVVTNLIEKGLVEEYGRLDLPGKPIAYKTTPLFLRSFCIESLDDLPQISDEKDEDEDEDEETETCDMNEDQQSLFE